MLQTRFELSNKPTRTGGLAIMLVIYIGGKRKRISTHIEVNTKSNFNYKAKKGHWITGVPDSKSLNQSLSDFITEAEAKYKVLDEGASAESVKLALKDKDKSDSFIQYAHDYLQTYYDRGQLSYWKAVRKSFNKFEKFAKSKNYSDVSFNDLSPRMIEDFKTFLIKQRNSRHPEMTLKASTINHTIKQIRLIVLDGIKHGKLAESKDPFKLYKPDKKAEVEKSKLTDEEIKALEGLELEEGSLLWHCRNSFLFSYYAAGLRIGDLLRMRWINIQNGRLIYIMMKNGKGRNLILVPQARAILAKYHSEESKPTDFIFPFLANEKAPFIKWLDNTETMPVEVKKTFLNAISRKTALINKYLPKLAEKAGINKKLSTHIARHSFAHQAMEMGITGSEVQNLLAHSDLSTTQQYMGSLDTSEADAALNKVFSSGKPIDKKSQLIELIQGMNEEQLAAMLEKINQ